MGENINVGTSDAAAVKIDFTDPCSGETRSIYVQVVDYTNYGIGELGMSAADYRAMIERDLQKDPLFAAKQLQRMGLDGTQRGETSGDPLVFSLNKSSSALEGIDKEKGTAYVPSTGEIYVDVNYLARTLMKLANGEFVQNNLSLVNRHEMEHLGDHEAGNPMPYGTAEEKRKTEQPGRESENDILRRTGRDEKQDMSSIDHLRAKLIEDNDKDKGSGKDNKLDLDELPPEYINSNPDFDSFTDEEYDKAAAAARVDMDNRNKVGTTGEPDGPVDDWLANSGGCGLKESSDFLEWIRDVFGINILNASPIVLDLDGDGIELSSLVDDNTSFFDLDNDGFAERTGWVDSDDGILVYDQNKDGRISDTTEWFGTANIDGFTIAAQYDLNADGILSAEDSIWTSLEVWRDHDQDGISDFGELYSLQDLDIISLDLNAASSNTTNSGHAVTHTSTYTYDTDSGTATRAAHDVWFNYDDAVTEYAQDYTLDMRAAYMASTRGYGTLPDLHIAISLDNDEMDSDSLISLMMDLDDKSFSDIFTSDTTIMEDVRAILYRWADVDTLTGNERGENIDSRELVFLEKLLGQDFLQRGSYSNPYYWAGQGLQEAFHVALNGFYARLVAQSAGGALFEGDWHYDMLSDSFVGVTGLDLTVLDTLETEAMGSGDPEVFWQNVIRMIEYSIGVDSLSGGDQTALDDAIYASNNSLSLSGILDTLEWQGNLGSTYNGTSGNDTLTGGGGDDEINAGNGNDTANGGGGADRIDAGAGDDTIDGGAGADLAFGKTGNDTYVYDLGDGVDTYEEAGNSSGTDTLDKISFGAGIDSGDITLLRAVNSTDLIINIDTGSQTGQIVIENQFNWTGGGGSIETILFNDTSTMALTSLNYTLTGTDGADDLDGVRWGGGITDTIYGEDGNDEIYGYDGNDTLYGGDGDDHIEGGDDNDTLYGNADDDTLLGGSGNDALHGGTGDDTISGNSGDDTYYYGGGHDTYIESSGTESIVLASGIASASTVYYRFGNDLQIVFDVNNTITITNHFSGSNNKIETLDFFSDTDVNLTTVSAITQGDSGNNTLNGTSSADYLYGNGGNDTLNAGNGNDFLYGGTGNDELNGSNGDDWLEGGAGDDAMYGSSNNDTYIYTSGHDVIYDTSGTDELRFIDGWEEEALVSFDRHIADNSDMVITINSANTITIEGQFANSNRLETIRFFDNSTITMTNIVVTTHGNSSNNNISGILYGGSLNDIIYGYAGDDSLTGGDGNDTLYGGDNNDTLNGNDGDDVLDGGAGNDTLAGHANNDTYVYTAGLDSITDTGGTDTLRMGGGIDVNAISFSNVSTYHTKITVTASTDEVTVNNLRHPTSSNHVEFIEFADGFRTSLPDYASWVIGTTGNDLIAYTSADETIIAKAGNDTITAGGGADDVHGGDGNDDISGEGGNDLLHGGAGDDILKGGDGLDTLYGGAGEDIFVFEVASAFNNIDVIKDFTFVDDAIDISDLLSSYDPMTDLLTDFVEMTTSGSDTILKVDRDGTGGTYSLAQIATIQGVTGLTNEDALVTNGNLIVV